MKIVFWKFLGTVQAKFINLHSNTKLIIKKPLQQLQRSEKQSKNFITEKYFE